MLRGQLPLNGLGQAVACRVEAPSLAGPVGVVRTHQAVRGVVAVAGLCLVGAAAVGLDHQARGTVLLALGSIQRHLCRGSAVEEECSPPSVPTAVTQTAATASYAFCPIE